MSQYEKYFDDQFDDEEVLFVFRKHPIVMRKGLVFGMFGPLIGVLPATFWPQLGFAWFFGGMFLGIVLGFLIMFPYWMSWHFSVFIMTNQRFIQVVQKSFFNRSVSDINLNQIQSMNYKIAGIEETLFSFGTIVLQTYIGEIELHDIHHPDKTLRTMQDIMRKEDIVPIAHASQIDQEDHEKTNE